MAAMERGTTLKRIEIEVENKLRSNLHLILRIEYETTGVFKEDIGIINNQLEAINKLRYQGATLRARAEMFWAHETPTKRAQKDDARYAKCYVTEEILWLGVLTSDKENIRNAFQGHYTKVLDTPF